MRCLGIDASTQAVKGVIIDLSAGEITASAAVNFGTDLPQYHSPSGFLPHHDPLIRHADPEMWLDGLDLLFQRLKEAGADLASIDAVSGSGQQHGSVYLNHTFEQALANLDPAKSLSEQLAQCFSRKSSPIWMDRSSTVECGELTAHFGKELQNRTGSPAAERFTGPQIRKFAKEDPEAYRKTSVIHLVSSFFCSVLCGQNAPIDPGDGAGMNLLHLASGQWDREIAEFTAEGLLNKLPQCVPANTIAGTLHHYFCKYGFRAGIPVVVWTGDNPSSLIGTGCAGAGTAGISLGTSDTVFIPTETVQYSPEGYGHVMGNPAGGFMNLICFTNGSLAREKVKMQCGVDWEFFDETSCRLTEAENHGKLMLPFYEAESTPLCLKPAVQYNFDPETASAEEKIRCILESQAVAMRYYSAFLPAIRKIRLTGGASRSKGFRQIIADVFNAPVETIPITDSAALGAAMRAANCAGNYPFAELNDVFCKADSITMPTPHDYSNLLEEYQRFIEKNLNP